MTFKEDVIRVLQAEVETLRSKNFELEAKLEVLLEDFKFNKTQEIEYFLIHNGNTLGCNI